MKTSVKLGLLCSMLLSIVVGCRKDLSITDELKLYNDVVSEIVFDNYYQSCLEGDSVQNLHQRFLSNKISDSAYLKILDSLKIVRKKEPKKCRIEFVESLGILTRDSVFDPHIRESIFNSLKDVFFTDHFSTVSIDTVFSCVSKPTCQDLSELQIQYLEIDRHNRSDSKNSSIGVIAISNAFFNAEKDKGILYYEFNCGPLCGHGQLVFLTKENNSWRIVEYKRIWDS